MSASSRKSLTILGFGFGFGFVVHREPAGLPFTSWDRFRFETRAAFSWCAGVNSDGRWSVVGVECRSSIDCRSIEGRSSVEVGFGFVVRREPAGLPFTSWGRFRFETGAAFSCVGVNSDGRWSVVGVECRSLIDCRSIEGRSSVEVVDEDEDGEEKLWSWWVPGGGNFGGFVQKKQVRFSDASASGSLSAQRT